MSDLLKEADRDGGESSPPESPLDDLLRAPLRPIEPLARGSSMPVVAELVALDPSSRRPIVLISDGSRELATLARTTIALGPHHVGLPVLVLFESGDSQRPIVVGAMSEPAWPDAERPASVEVDVDGGTLVVAAREQLVFRCGLASVTLRRDGKIVIDGTAISSRASGVQRIKGGSVQIN